MAKRKSAEVYEKVIAPLPEKAKAEKRKDDIKMANHAHDYQRELYEKHGKKGTISSIPSILDVKSLWETGVYTSKEISEMVGQSHHSVKSIVASLNKTQFRSPKVRALAVKATKDILENCPDDSIRLKMITKIFPDEQVQQTGSGVSVNLNIKGSELALKNPNFEFEDLDSF